jgi:hypothetical protein
VNAIPVQRVQGTWIDLAESTEYPKLAYAMNEVKKVAGGVFPELADMKLFVGCPHCMDKHSHHQWKDSDRTGKNWRAFMHTNHFPKTICVHPHAEKELEMRNLLAMLFHEFGHSVCDIVGWKNTQENADRASFRFFGVEIFYEGPGRVQTIKV